MAVEYNHPTNPFRRGLDGIHDGRALALAEVRDTLHQCVTLTGYHRHALNHSPTPPDSALLDLSVRDFLGALASRAPTPGGGAAAALAGAVAAALIEMTANLTIGKPKFASVEEQARRIASAAAELQYQFQDQVEADARAFGRVSAAYRLPKSTDAERQARSASIQTALSEAAAIPLEAAKACAVLLELCETAAPVLNPAVISDVLVGALLAQGALESAAVNVEVNVAAMSDAAAARRLAAAVAEARAGAAGRVERILAVGRSRFT
jgi:formiminotetrahydrofolate cyclodeaminase